MGAFVRLPQQRHCISFLVLGLHPLLCIFVPDHSYVDTIYCCLPEQKGAAKQNLYQSAMDSIRDWAYTPYNQPLSPLGFFF